jgi:RimJ/RimL family protein N-acetyltransferase
MGTWETARLLLRPLAWTDLEALYRLYREPLLMQYITGQPRTYEQTQARLRQHIADHRLFGSGLYATILKSTGVMIGRCGMEILAGDNGLEGTLAWMLAQSCWGLGLATEFACAMIPYGFAHTSVIRISASADPHNLASIRVMQKAGMTLVYEDAYGVEYDVRRPRAR